MILVKEAVLTTYSKNEKNMNEGEKNLMHIAAKKLILLLQSLDKALWSNDPCFLLL